MVLQGKPGMSGLELLRGRVLPDWIDVNGHMNVVYYTLAIDQAIDALWGTFGITDEHIQTTNGSTFAAEMHITYRRELVLDEEYIVTADVLAFSEKGIHMFLRMYQSDAESLVCAAECVNLYVDLAERRVTPWPGEVLERIRDYTVAQGDIVRPVEAGRVIKLNNPMFSIGEVAR